MFPVRQKSPTNRPVPQTCSPSAIMQTCPYSCGIDMSILLTCLSHHVFGTLVPNRPIHMCTPYSYRAGLLKPLSALFLPHARLTQLVIVRTTRSLNGHRYGHVHRHVYSYQAPRIDTCLLLFRVHVHTTICTSMHMFTHMSTHTSTQISTYMSEYMSTYMSTRMPRHRRLLCCTRR